MRRSNTEFFLPQYMGSFPVAIPDIASRAEFVRSQLEILRVSAFPLRAHIGKEFEDYRREVFSSLGTYVNATRHRSNGNTKRLICRSFYYSLGLTFTRGSTSQTTDGVSTALTEPDKRLESALFQRRREGAFLPLENEDKLIEGYFWRKTNGVVKEEGTFLPAASSKTELHPLEFCAKSAGWGKHLCAGIPKYTQVLLGILKKRYSHYTSPNAAWTRVGVRVDSRRSSGAARRVALTAGQRTRIANSCTPCGGRWLSLSLSRPPPPLSRVAFSIEPGIKRTRSHGKDRERDRGTK
ncbi:hypothetical protein X777_02532 [Ooceraea biroi]|uniref:Uncharacterized protein n=1 Tax=Ooceraea biroi TaxID=2015173 RepID=A0A026WNM8_OOCBI|nr:hypothetical protein X777_02532 [Ooceraea biroi]